MAILDPPDVTPAVPFRRRRAGRRRRLLGARALGGLAAGASSPASMSVTVPATTAAGSYRIVAVADAAGQQVELDETNDVALSAPLSVSR